VTRASILALAACLAALPGCGARAALEVPEQGAAPEGPPPHCSAWKIAGPAVTLDDPDPGGTTAWLGSMIPSAGGALLSWISGEAGTPWRAVALDFDATPRAAVETRPTTGGPVSLAASGSSFAGIVADGETGPCTFLPLDEDGAEVGPATPVDTSNEGCFDLAPTPDGFSFVTLNNAGADGYGLVSLDAAGNVLARTPLATPMYALYDGPRLVLHDASFLVATRDAPGTRVRRFSPVGEPLAPLEVVVPHVPFTTVMAETSAGVLAAWGPDDTDPGSVYVRPLDEDGSPTGASARVFEDGEASLTWATFVSTPAGDALLAWSEGTDFDGTAYGMVSLYVMAFDPVGVPRGAPTLLGSFPGLEAILALVSPDGRRALLALADGSAGKVLALPLACVP
jgi:hypothetical protein